MLYRTLLYPSLVLCFALLGCGGGTSGTSGTETRTLQGIVRTSAGSPIPGATMSLKEGDATSASTTTDLRGRFSMAATGSSFDLEFRAEPVTARVKAQSSLASPSTLSLDITVNGGAASLETREGAVKLTDECISSFDVSPSAGLVQVEDIDPTITCFVSTTARLNKRPARQSLVSLECDGSALVSTTSGENGDARLPLPLDATTRACRSLRVVLFAEEVAGLRIELPVLVR